MSDTNLHIHLIRQRTSDQGTEGTLLIPSLGFSCFTLELPWRDNQSSISCIPTGQYDCRLRVSPRFRRELYQVRDVPNRSFVLIHSGNYAGDVSCGFKSHVEGCILLGTQRGIMHGQRAVLCSKIAVMQFMAACEGHDLTMTLEGGF